MENVIKDSIDSVINMTQTERNILLCKLAVKEELNTLLPHEALQLEFIQAIRTANGEIDAVLKKWEEYPELDPRKQ